jgi:HSP20 family protein
MLVQTDPLRDFDNVVERFLGGARRSSQSMPLDAYRRGENVWVHLDLPGVAAASIDVSVERNVLTVTAERDWQREGGDQVYLAERHRGAYRRQIHLGEGLAADRIEADYHDGVLTLRIPVAEQAKPRKIVINRSAIDVDTTAAAG